MDCENMQHTDWETEGSLRAILNYRHNLRWRQKSMNGMTETVFETEALQ